MSCSQSKDNPNEYKKTNPLSNQGVLRLTGISFYLDGKGNTTRSTTLEDDVRTEVSNEHLAKVDGLHLELPRQMLDGDALTTLVTSDDGVEVDLVRISSREHSSSHLCIEPS